MQAQQQAEHLYAVVGATGLVGREVLAILAQRGVLAHRIRALASERSAGRVLPYASESLPVGIAAPDAFEGVTFAIFCADVHTALHLAPHAVRAGATVIDNSSAFRSDPTIPLVVPEINAHLLDEPGTPIIANPNCSTIILLAALEPLRRKFGIDAIQVATYQAVSGAGQAGIDDLHAQAYAAHRDQIVAPAYFQEPCAFNVFSHDSAVDLATGVNGEERKIIDESRKIWNDPHLRVTPTCLRVPVLRAHTQAITVEFGSPATEVQVRFALQSAPGLRLIDDRASNAFPTPLKATGLDEILIGRIRPDPGRPGGPLSSTRRWCMLVCADQLRKGAALNALQIADRCVPNTQKHTACV